MKSKLEHINVYNKRGARNPIDWDAIEAKRNEGYEPVFSIGSLADALRNPSTAPVIVVFRKEEGPVIEGGYAEMEAEYKTECSKSKALTFKVKELEQKLANAKKKVV